MTTLRKSTDRFTSAEYYGNYATGGVGFVRADGSTPLTGDWNVGNYRINSQNSLQWFNVKAYGAVGNGSADDRTAIVNAITAASAVDGVVYFPPGSYKISATINVTPPIAFVGDDRDTSIILLPDNSDGFYFPTHPGGLLPAVWFRDLQFKTFSGAAATAGAYIHLQTTPSDLQFFVDRCKFGYHYRAIQLNSAEYSVISRTMFIISNNTAGSSDIYIENLNNPDAGDIGIVDSHFSTQTESCIWVRAAGGIRINGCKFGGQPTQYVLVDLPVGLVSGLIQISDNSFQGYPTAAHLKFVPDGIYYITIISNNEFSIFSDSAPASIILAPSVTAFMYGLTITGNMFIDGAYAIFVDTVAADGVQSCLIDANNFYAQSTTAIRLPSPAGKCFNIKVGDNGFLPDGACSYITGNISGNILGNEYHIGKVSIGVAPIPSVPTNARLLVSKNLSGLLADTIGTVAQFVGDDGFNASLTVDSFGGGSSYLNARSAAGNASAPTATTTGHFLGGIQAFGYTGAAYVAGAGYTAFSTEPGNWAPGATGAGHLWTGTMIGTTVASQWMELYEGKLGIGNITPPDAKLHVLGDGFVTSQFNVGERASTIIGGGLTSTNPQLFVWHQTDATAATEYGTYSHAGKINADTAGITAIVGEVAISGGSGTQSGLLIATSGDTITNFLGTAITAIESFAARSLQLNSSPIGTRRAFHAYDMTGGGVGALTTQYGLYVDSLTRGATNYAVYTAGTTPSYFGGNIGIRKTTTAYDIDLVAASTGTTAFIVSTTAAAAGTQFIGRASLGTLASPSATGNGNVLGAFGGRGYGATGWSTVFSGMLVNAAENFTDTAQGTNVSLQTVKKGTVNSQSSFIIFDDGTLYDTLSGTGSANQMTVSGTLFTQTANSTTTANSLTTMLGTGVGNLTIYRGIPRIGRTIKLTLGGYVSAADGGAGTKTLTLYLGGVSVATATSGATFTTVLNNQWWAEAYITFRTVGAGGTVIGGARFDTQIASANLCSVIAAANATAAANTTGDLAVDIKFNNGNATGTITTTYALAEIVGFV